MAYGNKYSTTYCDEFGRNCVVYILQDGYAGATTELDAEPDPFLITYDSSEDFQFEALRPSTCAVNLILGDGIDLDEFYTANEREYKIEHYIDGSLDWVGWMLPDGFQQQLTGGLYSAVIEGTDGITSLEAEPYVNPATGENYGVDDLGSPYQDGTELYFFDQILVLCEALKKTDLGLEIWVAVDVVERLASTTSDARTSCPLAVTEVNVRTYIGDTDQATIPYWRDEGQAFNTLEVLEATARLWGAKVYQERGKWIFKRVNADTDFTGRYYYKFNEAAAYLGREALTDFTVVPCLDREEPKGLIGTDHIKRTDAVFKRFRVNYKYQYGREGDTFLNLIKNGDFLDPWSASIATSAPPLWRLWRDSPTKAFPKISPVNIAAPAQAEGYTNAIEFGTGAAGNGDFANNGAALEHRPDVELVQNDRLTLTFWASFTPVKDYSVHAVAVSVVLFGFDAAENKEVRYYLSYITGGQSSNDFNCQWYDWDDGSSPLVFRPATFYDSDQWRNRDGSFDLSIPQWLKMRFNAPALPISGKIVVRFHGLVYDNPFQNNAIIENITGFPIYITRNGVPELDRRFTPLQPIIGNSARLLLAGVRMGIVPEENDRDEFSSYIVENANQGYRLQREPTEVLHGDIDNPLAISKLYIKGQDREYVGKWDDLDGTFGYSSLALNLARSVMQLYSLPGVIMEGAVQKKDLNFGSVFEFDAIPGVRFILQRATFSRKYGLATDATFLEIGPSVVEGGTEDGQNQDPQWQVQTSEGGNAVRCEQSGGTNTGYLEVREVDINPYSVTYNTVRWSKGPLNTDACPIGGQQPYYCGFSGATLTTSDLEARPGLSSTADPGWIYFKLRNPGDLYLYICHLPSLGTITAVKTPNQNDQEDDFTYQADATINGTTYKVFRQNYPTTTWQLPVAIQF